MIEEYLSGTLQQKEKSFHSHAQAKKGFNSDKNQMFTYTVTKQIRLSQSIMNNFSIHKVARSFTKVGQNVKDADSERVRKKQISLQLNEIGQLQAPWIAEVVENMKVMFDDIDQKFGS